MCNCDKKLDEKLAPLNGRLVRGFVMAPGKLELSPVFITVEKLIPRGKKPPRVVASYCPFCGAKFEPEQFEKEPL